MTSTRTDSRIKPEAGPPALLAGPYRPPGCKVGDWINDEVLGLVEVAGWTEAPLSWPRRKHRGLPVLVLTEELVRAIRTESSMAVSYWWGVSKDKVRMWRRELGVDRTTPGTRQLLQDRYDPTPEQLARWRAGGNAPETHAKAAASRRGKPAAEATRAALRRGAKKPKSSEWGQRANAWMLAGKKAKASDPGSGA